MSEREISLTGPIRLFSSWQRKRRRVWFGRLMVPVVIYVIWAILHAMYGEGVVASPAATFTVIRLGIADGWLLVDLWYTLYTMAQAYAIVTVLGVVLGVAIGYNDTIEKAMSPIFLGIYAIPKITLYPVFILFFGITVSARVAFAVFLGTFPVLLIVIGGMAAVSDTHVKIARSFNMGRFGIFRKVIIPSILPFIVTALRLGYSITFLGVVVAELFLGVHGLGTGMIEGQQLGRMDALYALVVMIVFVGVTGNMIIYAIEQWVHSRAGGEDVGLDALSV